MSRARPRAPRPVAHARQALAFGREVLAVEARAVADLGRRLGRDFSAAVDSILACRGRVVVTGMGKTGLIGQKISATLASTGTPSLYVHPAEAAHGDLGRITADDIVLAVSNSGETEELLRLLPPLRRLGASLVSVTASRRSTLGARSDLVLELGRIEEACPLGLAPSASTTACLALGDALALAVQHARGFSKEEYALFHPAGDLGRRLLTVREVMRTGPRNPLIRTDRPVAQALAAITRARAGAILVVDGRGRLAGIFTDGDLRRHLANGLDLGRTPIGSVMTARPVTIHSERLAAEAARLLREKKIDELPVVDGRGRPVGMLDVQDLLAVGLV